MKVTVISNKGKGTKETENYLWRRPILRKRLVVGWGPGICHMDFESLPLSASGLPAEELHEALVAVLPKKVKGALGAAQVHQQHH